MIDSSLVAFSGRILCYSDALIVIYACQKGILPMVNRRLTDMERRQIRPGDVFVFDEAIAGIKRWADGRVWSSSRFRDSFLTYIELGLTTNISGFGRPRTSPPTSSSGSHGGNPHALLLRKKALSVLMSTGERLRLVSYSNALDDDSTCPSHPLISGMTPTQDSRLACLKIPKSLFRPVQTNKRRSSAVKPEPASTSNNLNLILNNQDASCPSPLFHTDRYAPAPWHRYSHHPYQLSPIRPDYSPHFPHHPRADSGFYEYDQPGHSFPGGSHTASSSAPTLLQPFYHHSTHNELPPIHSFSQYPPRHMDYLMVDNYEPRVNYKHLTLNDFNPNTP